jgi:hypothetical protein
MGMSRINGPEALPLKPAGWDSLGKATNNICEAASLYTPGFVPEPQEPEKHTGKVIGQNVTLDLQTLYFVRHAEKVDKHRKPRKRGYRKPGTPLRRIVDV